MLDAIRRPTSLQAAYAWAIDDALRGAGIERAHRQIDVSLQGPTNGEDAREPFARPAPEGDAPREPPTRNDAAAAVSEEARVAAREREADRRAPK